MSLYIIASVFLATMCIDALHALYTIRLTERKALQSATFGTMIHLFTAFTVISYTKNYWYILPLLAGSFLGTYITVKFSK
jgi:presenilin-like A22 family membrane protease